MVDVRQTIRHTCEVMIRSKYTARIDAGMGIALCLASAVLLGDPERFAVGIITAALWLAMAWKQKISLTLTGVLLLFAARADTARVLPPGILLACASGLGAWVLLLWNRTRWAVLSAAVLWGTIQFAHPAFLFLCLLGTPRLVPLSGEFGKWTGWTVLGLTALACVHWVGKSALVPMVNLLADAEHAAQWWEAVSARLQVQTVWAVLPMISGLELAQKQNMDHRFTGRQFTILGAVSTLFLFPPAMVIPLWFWIGFPLCGILVTRWLFALPDLWMRGVFLVTLLWWGWIATGGAL